MSDLDDGISAATAALRASRSYERAVKAWDDHIVAMIGAEQPVPTFFGDNQGKQPVAFIETGNLDRYLANENRHHPVHPVIAHEIVYVPTDRHAKRLKAALDRAFLGDLPDNAMRYNWRDAAGYGLKRLWEHLLESAVLDLAMTGEEIDAYDAREREARIIKSMIRRMA